MNDVDNKLVADWVSVTNKSLVSNGNLLSTDVGEGTADATEGVTWAGSDSEEIFLAADGVGVARDDIITEESIVEETKKMNSSTVELKVGEGVSLISEVGMKLVPEEGRPISEGIGDIISGVISGETSKVETGLEGGEEVRTVASGLGKFEGSRKSL